MSERVLRMAVAGLALVTLFVVIGIVLLAAFDNNVPDALVAIGSASGGALAGMVSVRSAPTFYPQERAPDPRPPMQPTTVAQPPRPRAQPVEQPTEATPTADYRYQPPPWEQ